MYQDQECLERYLKYKHITYGHHEEQDYEQHRKMEIIYYKKPILVEYNEYRREINPSVHYGILCDNKDIYNTIKDQDEL